MKVPYLKTLFLISFLFLAPASSLAQEKKLIEHLDGNEWLEWDLIRKSYFIGGFISGSYYVLSSNILSINYEKFSPEKGHEILSVFVDEKKTIFTRQEVELLIKYTAYLEKSGLDNYSVAYIPTRQISDGLDSFYADFKNRKIRISDPIYVVKKQIQGASSDEIEMLCQWLRSDRDPKKLSYTDKDGKMKIISFP